MMSSYVHISPEELLRVCRLCLSNIKNYKGEDDKISHYNKFCLKSLKTIQVSSREYPRWVTPNRGITPRLKVLADIAKNVLDDEKLQDRDIKLTLTTHSNLYMLLNKDARFQPDVFAMGY